MKEILSKIVDQFKTIESIETILLAGSTAAHNNDESSDFDIYIYSNEEVDIEKRTQIAQIFSDKYEINNQYFETGDEWILRDNEKVIDIMYRSPKWAEEQVENVWVKNYASVGYTTCFLYNIKNSQILYDKTGWFKTLQKKLDTPYPERLVKNIINKNLPLLKAKLCASYKEQIIKAEKRDDYISVNHRICAFLASYFDILFAKNKLLHPGEKRLVNFALNNCEKLPGKFQENITKLISKTDTIGETIDKMVENLTKI